MATKKILKQKRQRVVGRLPDLAQVVRGSLVKRYLPCGKAECRCHQGQGHGPYYYLMTTVGPGKTRMVLISKGQLRLVRRWVKNFGEYKNGLEKITEINTRLLQMERESKSKTAKSRLKRKQGKEQKSV